MDRSALFLARDGIINVDYGYIHRLEQFEFVPGIFELAVFGAMNGVGRLSSRRTNPASGAAISTRMLTRAPRTRHRTSLLPISLKRWPCCSAAGFQLVTRPSSVMSRSRRRTIAPPRQTGARLRSVGDMARNS